MDISVHTAFVLVVAWVWRIVLWREESQWLLATPAILLLGVRFNGSIGSLTCTTILTHADSSSTMDGLDLVTIITYICGILGGILLVLCIVLALLFIVVQCKAYFCPRESQYSVVPIAQNGVAIENGFSHKKGESLFSSSQGVRRVSHAAFYLDRIRPRRWSPSRTTSQPHGRIRKWAQEWQKATNHQISAWKPLSATSEEEAVVEKGPEEEHHSDAVKANQWRWESWV